MTLGTEAGGLPAAGAPPEARRLSLKRHLLESGQIISPVQVAYETYGRLNSRGDNALLVCHALTGSSHVARHGPSDPEPGWWEGMVGPGLALDTERYFVLSSNVLGGCYGTTGPSSVNPSDGRPYGTDFPAVTVRDMVSLQYRLVRALGIRRLAAVIGGSMGGMLALEWALMYPELVGSLIPIGACGRLSAQGIAFNRVQSLAITQDPAWNQGHYYGRPRQPEAGLALARMVGTITYRSEKSWERRFHRRPQPEPEEGQFGVRYAIEGYLDHQGQKLSRRFDANTYLYLARAMDHHDISRGRGSYREALERIQSPLLSVGISSDFLFPPHQQRELATSLRRAGRPARYAELETPHGHDGFLIEVEALSEIVVGFLEAQDRKGGLSWAMTS